MEYTLLGRTGLRVSVAGLGCGGPSRLGLRESRGEAGPVALVRQAIDLGINLLDTAEAYGTEPIVGKAIQGLPRDRLFISTKKRLPPAGRDPAQGLRRGLEASLRNLKTDYIDIYHLHGVEPQDYSHYKEGLVPVLFRLREEGKIRLLGITEAFIKDTSHAMLKEALDDGIWDVVMVGFNILNQTASATIFPKTRERDVGTLVMFAVRRAFSRPERLREIVADLERRELLDLAPLGGAGFVEFLLREAHVASLPEAAYRFCRHEPGAHVTLTGTGNPDHLRANVESLLKPPLPDDLLKKLKAIFKRVDGVTGG